MSTNEVIGAIDLMKENKRICQLCAMNNGKCPLKDAFVKNLKARSCKSFKLRGKGESH